MGSSSIASQMTAACSGETRPSRSASRVAVRSVTRSLAWRTVRRPVRGWVPARWVYQSPVEDHARCCLAILRSSTSARAAASTAARCARSVSHAATVSTISSAGLAAQRVSSTVATIRLAAARTPAGPPEVKELEVVLSMGPWKHRPPTVGGRWPARISAYEHHSKKCSNRLRAVRVAVVVPGLEARALRALAPRPAWTCLRASTSVGAPPHVDDGPCEVTVRERAGNRCQRFARSLGTCRPRGCVMRITSLWTLGATKREGPFNVDVQVGSGRSGARATGRTRAAPRVGPHRRPRGPARGRHVRRHLRLPVGDGAGRQPGHHVLRDLHDPVPGHLQQQGAQLPRHQRLVRGERRGHPRSGRRLRRRDRRDHGRRHRARCSSACSCTSRVPA